MKEVLHRPQVCALELALDLDYLQGGRKLVLLNLVPGLLDPGPL